MLLQRWSNAFVRQLQLRDRMRRLEAFTASAHPAVEILVPIAVIAIGGSAVIEGTMSIGELFAVSTIAPSFVGPVTSLASELEGLITVRGLAVRVNDVLEQESEIHRECAKNKVELGGGLRFDSVSFGFGESPVLRDFSLDVRPGSTVALVGHSGSGKSTVVNLLLGMYRPKSGSVLLDDIPLDTLDVLHVRRQMGVVPQTVQVLEGTFRSNITLGAEGHEQNLEWAAWVAMLDERIGRESSGYETPVLEGGASLSGGERQRISLARAVISKPRILILDEATSALDSQTERSVFDRLRQVPCTKIVIAHRLSTIRHADHIVVLDRGRIVEQGTHDQLIGRAGPYTRLLAVDGGAR